MEGCCDCRCCGAQALHHSSDWCQHQQPAQSPHLVSVSHLFMDTATENRFCWIRLSLPNLSCLFSFNRIDIPPYEGYDKLYDKLLTAIEETCGFAVEWDALRSVWAACSLPLLSFTLFPLLFDQLLLSSFLYSLFCFFRGESQDKRHEWAEFAFRKTRCSIISFTVH